MLGKCYDSLTLSYESLTFVNLTETKTEVIKVDNAHRTTVRPIKLAFFKS